MTLPATDTSYKVLSDRQ